MFKTIYCKTNYDDDDDDDAAAVAADLADGVSTAGAAIEAIRIFGH